MTVKKAQSTAESEAPAQRSEQVRTWTLVALTVFLLGLTFLIAVPFLSAITWAVALAIVAGPLQRWVARRIPNLGWSAAATTAMIVSLIVIPGAFVSYQLARETAAGAGRVSDSIKGGLREKIEAVPGLRNIAAWTDQMDIDLEKEIGGFVQSYMRDLGGLARGSLTGMIQFLVAVFLLYFIIRDRGIFVGGLRSLLPLTREESERVFARAADTVHASLFATVATSATNGVIGGTVFWLVGLPSPLLWAVVIFVLGVIPILGSALVWIPAVAYLCLSGMWGKGMIVLSWGLLSALFVDNLFYVRLAGKRMRMHPVLALVAFMGGVAVFGISGMILGPAIIAVTMAFLEFWQHRLARDDAAESAS